MLTIILLNKITTKLLKSVVYLNTSDKKVNYKLNEAVQLHSWTLRKLFFKSSPRTPQHCFVLGALRTEKEVSFKQTENMRLFLHFRALVLHTNPKF
jgi:hypothetical protein